MKLWLKILWTVVIVICGVGGTALIGEFFSAFSNLISGEEILKNLFAVILAWIAILPMWFVWKGTKLIPVICNLVTRIVIIVVLVALPMVGGIFGGSIETTLVVVDAVAIIGFAMVGLWLKS